MNGIHDMGGMHWLGPVPREENEPVFHSRWEARVFCITQVLDTTGIYNLDEHRHEIELMHPASYLRDTYYGRWLFAMESILARKGIVHRHEVERRIAERARDAQRPTPADPAARNWPLPEEQKIRWGAWRHEVEVAPLFAEGEVVRVRNLHPPGHTRLCAYVRGHVGRVVKVNDQAWVFPDTRAHNAGENLQPVYNVCFTAQELWGEAAEPGVEINVDLSEAYLERVE
ncbi:nitrile hydratase subunit beta [Zavarzinia sp. CC-PAN008]|uniref:nitrile hydratase subunit beta n=1 Tax=Zavarzinia sp. CC-PAN008 TaxID=3243332 RepID=UPI003F74861A